MKNSLGKKPANSIKAGDMFSLGNHLLLCGDSTDEALVQKFLKGQKIDLILTDPPYGVAYVEGKKGFLDQKEHKAIANDHEQSEEEYGFFTQKWLSAVAPSLSKKNAFYIFNSDHMLFGLKKGAQRSGFFFAQLLIWIKSNAVLGRKDYLPQHELIAYGWRGTHKFLKSKDKSVLFYPKPQKNDLHPTMKPVGLLRHLILNSTRIGESIYDPFGGSGSTLIACEQTKRKCLMVELDPEYCQVIIDRFEKLTKVKPQKLPALSLVAA